MRLAHNNENNMNGSFKRKTVFPGQWVVFGRIFYGFRALFRQIRILKPLTRILGPQYTRSRSCIEIDITYLCNLHCLNCNRSASQAPEAMHITLERIKDFVSVSIERNHRWERIRILGGEPTLHPQFHEIIEQLLCYRNWFPACRLEVVTNGHGVHVQSVLAALPKDIWVENSKKTDQVQTDFGPFNLAPCDDPRFSRADYRNGCAIMEECGMGLTPLGYYPCAIAGGIDRIAGLRLGHERLPDLRDDMLGLVEPFCSLCGRFRAGHFIPKNLRPELLEPKMSPTWVRLYADWAKRVA